MSNYSKEDIKRLFGDFTKEEIQRLYESDKLRLVEDWGANVYIDVSGGTVVEISSTSEYTKLYNESWDLMEKIRPMEIEDAEYGDFTNETTNLLIGDASSIEVGGDVQKQSPIITWFLETSHEVSLKQVDGFIGLMIPFKTEEKRGERKVLSLSKYVMVIITYMWLRTGCITFFKVTNRLFNPYLGL